MFPAEQWATVKGKGQFYLESLTSSPSAWTSKEKKKLREGSGGGVSCFVNEGRKPPLRRANYGDPFR